MKTINLVFGLVLVAAIVVGVLLWSMPSDDEPSRLILATTTSTYDSGLLDYLLPDYESTHGVQVDVISVGTGQAIKNGENGDADVLLVHAPASELKFVADGHGIDRNCVMYNDFIILGPKDDPANAEGKEIEEALQQISSSEALFVSRGDDSGTHKKELALWKGAGIEPAGDWYLDVGSGMGDALRIANEKQAYILSDRGTYLALKDTLELEVMVEGDDSLLNPYGVIAVNPGLHKNVNYDGAEQFIDWIMSEDTQLKIDAFRKNGERMFTPLRGSCIGG